MINFPKTRLFFLYFLQLYLPLLSLSPHSGTQLNFGGEKRPKPDLSTLMLLFSWTVQFFFFPFLFWCWWSSYGVVRGRGMDGRVWNMAKTSLSLRSPEKSDYYTSWSSLIMFSKQMKPLCKKQKHLLTRKGAMCKRRRCKWREAASPFRKLHDVTAPLHGLICAGKF